MPHAPSPRPRSLLLAATLAGLFIGLSADGAQAQRASPSFDCRKAGKAAERAICGSENLAALDRALARAYRGLRRGLGRRARRDLLRDQLDWLAERNRCGRNRRCLEAAIRARLEELGAPVAAAPPPPPPPRRIEAPRAEARQAEPMPPERSDGAFALTPVSRANVGPLLFRPDSLEMEDGVALPLERVDRGVYRLLSPVSGELANGRSFCAHMPITFLTLHQGASGLFFLNAGSWKNAPPPPASGDMHVSGACMMATYEAG